MARDARGDLAALRASLQMLAAPSAQQRRHAGTLRAAARLHFEANGTLEAPRLVATLAHEGRLSDHTLAAIEQVDTAVFELHGARGAAAFTPTAMDEDPRWEALRALARRALRCLDAREPAG